MNESKINLSSLDFVTVCECSINKEMNSHCSAKITGIIKETDHNKVMQMLASDDMEQILFTDGENKQTVLFSGVIENAEVIAEGQLRKASFTLAGGTKLLDVVEKTRTFQDKSMTYEQLLTAIESNYVKAFSYAGVETSKPIGDIIVQYKETDWEFIKRLASHFQTSVFPNLQLKGSMYYFGVPDSSKIGKIEAVEYSIENHADELRLKTENGVSGLISEDAWVYSLKSRDNHELGEAVIFQGKKLYVAKAEIHLENAELIYHYKLKRKNGLKVVKAYNKKIIGASLGGDILDISTDKVKVHVSSDKEQDIGGAKWFSYSTVYSSPDGTGWYCMPEKNDRVRLYFPNEKEEDGYIISSIHENVNAGGKPGARSNPDNKNISTKYGKQVEMTPTSITMTNNNGMTVRMDDKSGISIISDKDIVFKSDGAITMMSVNDTMSLTALESIELIQGNTKMTLKDDVTVEGAQIKMQ